MSSLITNKTNGEVVIFRKTTAETRGAYLELETSLPPRAKGPPLHTHLLQDESGEVLCGRMGLRVGGRVRTLGVGERFSFPKGVSHTFWNAGDEELRIRGVVRPAGNLERFLREMFGVLNASPTCRPSLFEVAYLLEHYRDEYRLERPPRWLQDALFPWVVALGKRLGKYDAAWLERLGP